MSILEVQRLTKHYKNHVAVEDINFTVQRGQVFGFLGPNGSGKTTTIGMIFGIVTPTSGSVALFGRNNPQDLAQSRRRLGGTLEQPNLYPYLTGRDNLRLVAAIKGIAGSHVDAALRAVDMMAPANRETRSYSLGMRQRLALAAAMLGDPELLILDEPTNGLDPEGMQEVRELIQQLARSGRTILLCTHLLVEVERICTHVAILNRGHLVHTGTVSDTVARAAVYRLCADNMSALLGAVRNYPSTRAVRQEQGAVFAELSDADPASLGRYLARQEIFLSELSTQRPTLEDVYFKATGTGRLASKKTGP